MTIISVILIHMAESSVDMEKVREFVKQKEKHRQERLDSRYVQACEDFEKMVSFIIRKYNPKRIYQWGSLLNREGFSEISDIDIAVEGMRSYEEFSRMYGDIEPMSSLSVDLVEIEKIHPFHAESIREKGKLVYERTE